MQFAITGAAGQLGWELAARLEGRCIALDRAACDVADAGAVERCLADIRPQVVINAGAYTKVDLAERDPATCWAVNALGVKHLAAACQRQGALLVQISTDYVFTGSSASIPYRETDPPAPRGVYASSKYAGELLATGCENHLVVRTSGLYGQSPGATNFVSTMLRLGRERGRLRVVNDQRCTPTRVEGFVEALLDLIERRARGMYHVTDVGETTWYDFARAIFAGAGLNVQVDPISSAEYGALAPRPAYSVLDTSKYHALKGPAMPTWQMALDEYLAAILTRDHA